MKSVSALLSMFLVLLVEASAFCPIPSSIETTTRTTTRTTTSTSTSTSTRTTTTIPSRIAMYPFGEKKNPRSTSPVRTTIPIAPPPEEDNDNDNDDDDDNSNSNNIFGSLFGTGKEKSRSTVPVPSKPRSTVPVPSPYDDYKNGDNNDDGNDSKFGTAQRLESIKCAGVGAISASLATAPVAYFHYIDSLAQFEFTTDMAAIQGALFAIVYRYAIREDDNPMLNSGAVGAFVLVRTVSNIFVSPSCSAIPLSCGEPLGYLDYSMLYQLFTQGLESAVLFGAASLAMDLCFATGWISKFKN